MSTILQTANTPCKAKTVLKSWNLDINSLKAILFAFWNSPGANGLHDIAKTHFASNYSELKR